MKKYKILALVCVAVAVICLLIAVFGSALTGIFQPETTPPVTETSELAETTETTETSESAPEEIPEEEPYVSPIDFETLKEENPDIFGWIEVENTEISYPLLQSSNDDTFYLTHGEDGSSSKAGSLFTEHVYNSTDMNDPVTIIYGHYMKSGTLFGSLQKIYSNEEDGNQCRNITVYLPDKEIHYEVFAAVAFSDDHLMLNYDFNSEDGVQKFLDDVASTRDIGNLYDEDVEVTPQDHLLVLSTCLKGDNTRRYLVIARMVS